MGFLTKIEIRNAKIAILEKIKQKLIEFKEDFAIAIEELLDFEYSDVYTKKNK